MSPPVKFEIARLNLQWQSQETSTSENAANMNGVNKVTPPGARPRYFPAGALVFSCFSAGNTRWREICFVSQSDKSNLNAHGLYVSGGGQVL